MFSRSSKLTRIPDRYNPRADMNAGEISPQREEQQRNEDQTLENFQDHTLDREQCGMEGQTRAHN